MSEIWSDLRFASRTLWAKPVLAIVAIASLALGIGANTAIFSVVESALLRGLPFRHAEQLVIMRDQQPCCATASVSPGEYLDYQKQTKTLSGLAAFTWQRVTLTGAFEPQRLTGASVATNFFDVLGAHAELGRLISPNIDKPGADTRVAVLGDAIWRSSFASDPGVIGRDITLNGSSFRVIGVLDPKQAYPSDVQVWISPRLLVPEFLELPTRAHWDIAQQYGNHWLSGLGRLQPGVTLSQARAELSTIASRIASQHPGEKDHHAVLFALQDTIVRNVRSALWVLLSAVLLLLLIACANLAGLLLARSTGRVRELAVRVSLGATRWQIIRLLLSESLLLAFFGGVLGVLLARAGLKGIALYSPYDLPAALTPELNLPVLAFCLGITLLSACMSGLIPALRSAQVDVNDGLREGSKGTAGGGIKRMRHLLVSAEIALSVMLLIAAGLLIHSFSKLISVDPGFEPKNVLTARLSLPVTRYSFGTADAFWYKLLPRLSRLPGMQAAGLLTNLPFSGSDSGSYLQIEGHPTPANQPGPYANQFGISSQTFQALHVPLIRGRFFNERDDAKAPAVAIINKHFAEKIFPHENPIGKRFKGGPVDDWATIVGVVGDIKYSSLDDKPELDIYFNYPQFGVDSAGLLLRTSVPSRSAVADLRAAVRELDPNLPLSNVKPLEDYIGSSLAARRFLLGLLTTFSGLAILLAGIGLYALLAYSVQQRKQEIGIRMTLGATSPDVLWIVLRESAAIVLLGVAAGLIAAFWSSSFLKSMLFEVRSTDLLAYFAGIGLIIAIALAASLVPALRASRVDPVSALRYE
jgi:putative ABC transport system permease protein